MGQATAVLLLLLFVVAACGGQAATVAPASARPQATPVAPQATANPPAATAPVVNPGGNGTSIAHVEVGGGPQAGTYDATGQKVDCNIAADGSGATFQDLAVTEGLSGLTFISGEGGATPTKIYFQVFFGPPAVSQPILEISTLDPSSARGKATAQLEDKGTSIKWTIDGATADGVTIKATIECGPVDRR